MEPSSRRADWLRPELVAPYRKLYGGGANVPLEYRKWLAARVKPLIHAHGLQRGIEDPATGSVRSTALGNLRNVEGERVSAYSLAAHELPPALAMSVGPTHPNLF